VLFFNAFELGAESGNQVISSDEVLGSAGALRPPFLPLLLTLGNTWLLQGGAIGVQIKSLLLVLVKSHNLVFSGVAILAKLKADK
jgi:hypothetical protein